MSDFIKGCTVGSGSGDHRHGMGSADRLAAARELRRLKQFCKSEERLTWLNTEIERLEKDKDVCYKSPLEEQSQ